MHTQPPPSSLYLPYFQTFWSTLNKHKEKLLEKIMEVWLQKYEACACDVLSKGLPLLWKDELFSAGGWGVGDSA